MTRGTCVPSSRPGKYTVLRCAPVFAVRPNGNRYDLIRLILPNISSRRFPNQKKKKTFTLVVDTVEPTGQCSQQRDERPDRCYNVIVRFVGKKYPRTAPL